MANVLGLSFFFHDSAAALVRDGQIVAAATEERFCRRKHTNEFPKRSIEYCLEEAELNSINDLDAIVFYEKPIVKLNRVVETLVAGTEQETAVESYSKCGLALFLLSEKSAGEAPRERKAG